MEKCKFKVSNETHFPDEREVGAATLLNVTFDGKVSGEDSDKTVCS